MDIINLNNKMYSLIYSDHLINFIIAIISILTVTFIVKY